MKQMFAIKRETRQAWTTSGIRIPVTVLKTQDNFVVKQGDAEYLGFGRVDSKKLGKAKTGTMKSMNLSFGVKKMTKNESGLQKESGDQILPSDLFAVGDIVDVAGTSKGMGFAGVMKLHGFHGGPKTHGQSDRARAPGASSSGTELGHLLKGKRMAARGGNKRVTIENLQIVAIDDAANEILVKGVIPGPINGTVSIAKVKDGKFEGLFAKKAAEEPKATTEEKIEEVKVVEDAKSEDVKPEDAKSEAPKEEVKSEEVKVEETKPEQETQEVKE